MGSPSSMHGLEATSEFPLRPLTVNGVAWKQCASLPQMKSRMVVQMYQTTRTDFSAMSDRDEGVK